MMSWYAEQTQPKRGNLAVEHLKRQDFSVWMPICERIIRHARKSKRVRRPLFPGYLFINLDVEILSGSMAGTIAKLLSLEAGDRVTVFLNMLGHFVRGKILREHVASI